MTMAFIALAFIQLFHAYNMRSQTHSIFNKNLFKNKMMNISFLVGTALMVLVVYIDPLTGADIFGTVAISREDWLISLACAFGIVPIVELQKLIERKVEENKNKNQKTLSDEEILL